MANEKRLIDANALQVACRSTLMVDIFPNWSNMSDKERNVAMKLGGEFKRIHNEAPTVDAVEVVHARWLYDGGSGKYFCSACDEDALSFKKDIIYGGDLYEVCLTDYCPNCGAKMDGGNEDGKNN